MTDIRKSLWEKRQILHGVGCVSWNDIEKVLAKLSSYHIPDAGKMVAPSERAEETITTDDAQYIQDMFLVFGNETSIDEIDKIIKARDARIRAETAAEIAAINESLEKQTHLVNAYKKTMSDNLFMAGRIARWRDLLLDNRNDMRRYIVKLKAIIRELLSSAYDDDPRFDYVEIQIDRSAIAEARALLKDGTK